MSLPLFLGVDGGGTSTTAWLGDAEGRVVGRGSGGPSNAKAVGLEASRKSLDRAIQLAFQEASIEPRPVEVACLGLAGFDRPEDKVELDRWSAGSPWAGRLVLVNDGDLVVAAGTSEGWGVGLIAGTGSIGVARDRDGNTARAGGWGYLFGDEGSGYAVALAGLRKMAKQADGRSQGGSMELGRRICDFLGIDSTSELVSAIYREGFDRARIASMAPLVVAASVVDPSIVAEILEPAGEELAMIVLSVARQLGLVGGTLPLAMAGSFLLNSEPVRRVVLDRLAGRGLEVSAELVVHPVEGALILARRGWDR